MTGRIRDKDAIALSKVPGYMPWTTHTTEQCKCVLPSPGTAFLLSMCNAGFPFRRLIKDIHGRLLHGCHKARARRVAGRATRSDLPDESLKTAMLRSGTLALEAYAFTVVLCLCESGSIGKTSLDAK